MLNITHRELLQFRQVARKTFGRLPARSTFVTLAGDNSGTTLLQKHAGVTLRYTNAERQEQATSFAINASDLRPFERASDDGVMFRFDNDASTCSIHSALTLAAPLTIQPAKPVAVQEPLESVEAEVCLLDQLAACASMTDPKISRFALQCVQLDGEAGAIAGTDGRKALRITGCGWPWEDVKLVPATCWFASSIVRKAGSIVGVHDLGESVRFTAGSWSIELPFQDGRYPDVARIFPEPWLAQTVLTLTEDDRDILSDALKALPKPRGTGENAVTLELGTPCRVRVGNADQGLMSEVVFPRASFTGPAYRAALPRHALADAVRLDFTELQATEAAKTFWCSDGDCQFAFMPLHPDFAVSREDAARSSNPKAA